MLHVTIARNTKSTEAGDVSTFEGRCSHAEKKFDWGVCATSGIVAPRLEAVRAGSHWFISQTLHFTYFPRTSNTQVIFCKFAFFVKLLHC